MDAKERTLNDLLNHEQKIIRVMAQALEEKVKQIEKEEAEEKEERDRLERVQLWRGLTIAA